MKMDDLTALVPTEGFIASPEVFQQIVKRFGKAVLTPAGELDRAALRRLV